jgi:tetratricopeptide (TPR) repeat protein
MEVVAAPGALLDLGAVVRIVPTHRQLARVAVAVAIAGAAQSCGGAQRPAPIVAPRPPTPVVVTDATIDDVRRAYLAMPIDDPRREATRQRLVDHILARSGEAMDAGYGAAVEKLAAVTSLYTPAELTEAQLPSGLEPLARYLVAKGSPRGDEARVLSALFVLSRIRPDQPEHARLYRKIKEWGFSSRAAMSAPLEEFDGLLETWEEHARLTPTPEVLKTLARLYVDRRDAMIELFQSSERRVPLSASVFHGVQQTAVNVAAVYLRQGDLASALTHVDAMGPQGGVEERLMTILQQALEDGEEGAGAILDLARVYGDGGYSRVTRALCVHGLRRRPTDGRFSQCLGRIAAAEGDFSGAMAHYAEAVRLSPDDRTLYDEILEVLNGLMEQGLFSADTTQTRLIANRATEILEERLRRWPDTPPPVKPEDLYLAIGIAEMNAGNAKEAEERLRRSLRAGETLGALMQLGLLLERENRGAEAADVYRRALLQTTRQTADPPRRAEILERLGDALRMQGEGQQASKMYEEGLALWDRNLSRLKGRRIGLAHLRRGILLGRLDRKTDSLDAFEKAIELAPEMRETYATILAHMVVSEADPGFAHRVFRTALNQLSLEPEWKVYFALWLRTIAARTGQPTDPDVDGVLKDVAEGDSWSAQLARLALGEIGYAQLLQRATDAGERTEAHFYEGTRRLAAGDREGAREMFEKVLQSHMVNFYEYTMAQELIGGARR